MLSLYGVLILIKVPYLKDFPYQLLYSNRMRYLCESGVSYLKLCKANSFSVN